MILQSLAIPFLAFFLPQVACELLPFSLQLYGACAVLSATAAPQSVRFSLVDVFLLLQAHVLCSLRS